MVKHKVTADVRSLADRYFCEQCDRLGLPKPHAIPVKPLKAPKQPVLKDNPLFGGLPLSDTRGFVTVGPAPKIGLEAIWEAFDGE